MVIHVFMHVCVSVCVCVSFRTLDSEAGHELPKATNIRSRALDIKTMDIKVEGRLAHQRTSLLRI